MWEAQEFTLIHVSDQCRGRGEGVWGKSSRSISKWHRGGFPFGWSLSVAFRSSISSSSQSDPVY